MAFQFGSTFRKFPHFKAIKSFSQIFFHFLSNLLISESSLINLQFFSLKDGNMDPISLLSKKLPLVPT